VYRPRRRRRTIKLLALSVIAMIAFLPGLGHRPIVTSHEARVAQTARQMAVSGWPWAAREVEVAPAQLVKTSDGITRLAPRWDLAPMRVNPWLVPVLNREIRLQKPPLPYWCAAILFRIAGVEWSEGLSRIAPAFLGGVATLLVYGLARRLLGRTAAWCAALVWVSTYFIAEQYRLAMADPFLSFFTLLCVWAWVAWVDPSPERQRRAWILLFYVSLALGLLAKGPPLLLLVAVPIMAFHVCYRRRVAGCWLGHLLGIAIVAAMVAPWIIYIHRHIPNVLEMWRYESVGELPGADNVEKARPFWFYLPNLFVMSAPWTAVWVLGICQPFSRGRKESSGGCHPERSEEPAQSLSKGPAQPDEPAGSFAARRWFPLTWYFTVILFFSLLPVKKNTYLLPAMPAQALLIAQALAMMLAAMRRSFAKAVPLAWAQAVIGVGLAIALVVLTAWRTQSARIAAVAVAALALAASCGAVGELRARRPSLWLWRQAIAYALTIAAFLTFYKADDDAVRSAKPVCDQVLALMRQNGEALALTKLPEEASLYLPLGIAQPQPIGNVLVIVDDPHHTVGQGDRLKDRVPGHKVLEVERIPLDHVPPDGRWKVFRLTVR
jgi:4-amino-4-deoxy-L-arabinose transferase-like glycosyltransferase